MRRIRRIVLGAYREGGARAAEQAILQNAGALPEPLANRIFRAQFQFQSTQHFGRFVSAMPAAAKEALGIVGPNSATGEEGLARLARMRGATASTVENAVARNVRNGRMVYQRHSERLFNGLLELEGEDRLSRRTLSRLLAKARRLGIGEVAFHGRDESETANGQYTRDRSLAAGEGTYEWATQGDDRVRPTHAELDGLVFQYGSPPPSIGVEPGVDWNCRCVGLTLFAAEAGGEDRALARVGPMIDIVSIHVAWRGYLRELARLDKLAA